MDTLLLREAGLTEGEAKVYLSLLKLGVTTTGPLIEESKVANSIIYRILESLIQKGLATYITKEKTKHFQAADPSRILDYIEEKKLKLDENKVKIANLIPQLLTGKYDEGTTIKVYEGFKGLQTAHERYYRVLKKGESEYALGLQAIQEEKYHLYWQRDHLKRIKHGLKTKLLFNQGTDPKILANRNSYKGCDARYMPSTIKTPAWIKVYKDTTIIFLQAKDNPVGVEIINQDIADTFISYFNDYWKKSKPFKIKDYQ